MKCVLALAFAVFVSLSAAGEQQPPRFQEAAVGVRSLTPPAVPARLDRPEVVLAQPMRLRSVEAANVAGEVRALPDVAEGVAAPTSFRSIGAARVRLQLRNVSLPPDAVAWVFGTNGEAIPFGAELMFEGTIWTPSVAGDSIALVLPETARATVSALGHLDHDVAAAGTECLTDVSCNAFTDRTEYSHAVAAYTYVKDANGLIYICTGALINSTSPSQERLFLTSASCISSASEAASLEAAWDFKTPACGGNVSVGAVTDGATLLAKSPGTDAALLRMTSVPAGRWFMGWDTHVLAEGKTLRRISHPLLPDGSGVYAQSYSSTSLSTGNTACPGAPRPNFFYSTRITGGVGPTSLGAPVIIDGGYIVGQLLGVCSFVSAADGCSSNSFVVDGALRTSYDTFKPYLDPSTSSVCVASSTTVCLMDNRFRVSIAYVNPFSNPPNQPGTFLAARLLQGSQNPDTALFGFASAQAVEVVVRVQDTRPFAPRFDVYYGGMTDVGYTITVTDTQTGTTRQYTNPAGKIGGGVDRASFPAF